MTSTRDRLMRRLCQEDNRHPDGHHDGCETICVHEGRDSVCPYLRDALAAIDELMEPGEGALCAPIYPMGHPTKGYKLSTWQGILKAIKEGK